MATVIDSLIVTLGLDPSKFTAGSDTARKNMASTRADAGKTAKELSSKGKEAAQFFSELRNQAIAFFAVLAGGRSLEELIVNTTAASAAMGLLAKNIGVTTETLNAWGNATQYVGGSANGLEGTMSMLSSSMTEMMVTGQTAILPYLRSLGINLADAAGKARPLDEVLLDMSDRLSSMDRVTANNIGKMMGIDQGTLNMILMGRKAVEEMIRKQKELHLVTKEDAAQALKLKAAFTDLKQSGDSMARDFTTLVTPGLMSAFNALKTGIEWLRKHQDFLAGFLMTVATVATVYFTPAIIRAAIALWALVAPFALVIIGITAIGAAIGLLYDDYQTWKKGGTSLIDWGKWSPGINMAIVAITKLRDLIADTFGWVVKFGSKLISGTKLGSMIESGAAHVKAYLGDKKAQSAIGANVLGDTIAKGEGTYTSINRGTSGGKILGSGKDKNLTNMTVGEVMAEQKKHEDEQKKGRSGQGLFAVGKYQIIPETMRSAVAKAGINKDEKFSPETQEKLLQALLPKSAKDYTSGKTDDIQSALKDMPKVWASIAAHGKNGASYYGSGNKASTSQEELASALTTQRAANMRNDLAPNPTALTAAAPAGARAAASPVDARANSTTTSETHIGEVKVYTQATDAKGIARDIGGALKSQGVSYQADQGLT